MGADGKSRVHRDVFGVVGSSGSTGYVLHTYTRPRTKIPAYFVCVCACAYVCLCVCVCLYVYVHVCLQFLFVFSSFLMFMCLYVYY
jgi:hypothetical protein